MDRVSTWLTRPVRQWLEAAEQSVTLKRCGGDQRCPWCRRWMNQHVGTFVSPFDYADDNPALDEIVCGHCGGSSLWKWEVGFIFVMQADPPPSPPSSFQDGEFIRGIIAQARADLECRRSFVEAVFPAENGSEVAVAQQRAPEREAPDAPNPAPSAAGEL